VNTLDTDKLFEYFTCIGHLVSCTQAHLIDLHVGQPRALPGDHCTLPCF